ncbi:MAG TPA: RluA family pseudouridine synthase [Candidatus Saccharimonadales bacterium]|nr:RluA family pseudouridine synthase [Candidatus Saccharimonadales bacterium]
MKYAIGPEQAGKRLDQFAAEQLPSLSRAYIQKLIEAGQITVNQQSAKPGLKLKVNDHVGIDYDKSAQIIKAIDLPILYEDEDCLVINKPAGVLTHALNVHGTEPSVASFIRSKVQGIEGERAGIVHRLDRATSGVIIGAKNQSALSWLQKQFSQRKTKKTYVAVVEGHPKQEKAVIDMPIGRNPKAPSTFRVDPNGKPAKTQYKVLKTGEKYSLVELTPETGRTHQLRVHLQKIGCPIVGDPLYGNGKYGDRLLLHAKSLEITLPNRQHKIFEAPLPLEFDKAVQ